MRKKSSSFSFENFSVQFENFSVTRKIANILHEK